MRTNDIIAERAAYWAERFTEVGPDRVDPSEEPECAAQFASRARSWERTALTRGARGTRAQRQAWILSGSLEAGEAWAAAVVSLLRSLGAS